MTPAAAVAAALDRALTADRVPRLGVAVSGGGDSMALLVLMADALRDRGGSLRAATVDHGLRPGSAAEAEVVAWTAGRLGVPHDTLKWQDGDTRGWDGSGNLQARARAARYGALRGWAVTHGLTHVCLGHTMDDQAETVLLRLARGSGVDGLSGMSACRTDAAGAPVWFRPALTLRRADLRRVLRDRGMDWVEDPSNTDIRFDRVRARAALTGGTLAGLDVPTLAGTATRMAAARAVLWQVARDAALRCATVDHGSIGFVLADFAVLHDDTRWRLLAAAVRRVAGLAYRPRLGSLIRAETSARAGSPATIAGCVLSVSQGRIWVDREPAALTGVHAPAPGGWDGRWQVTGPAGPGDGVTLAALGPAGLSQCPGWRKSGLRRRAILTAPGVWHGSWLVAAPTLPGCGPSAPDWSSHPVWDTVGFCDTLRPD